MGSDTKNILTGLILLILFSMLLNLPYIHMREFQGEEGRRVIIAQEMLKSGDYIVPKVEGEVYLNKPPLYNWFLALIFRISGNISEFTARLSSVIAVSFSSLILSIFWMNVSGASGVWFILPGVIFLTLPEVMDKAIRAEIDMTFTFFITLSSISWFYLIEIKRKPFYGWVVSLGFLSLATLAKGVQAPLFFYCGIIPFLVYKKRFRDLFSLAHLTGVVVYLLIFMSWFLPLIKQIELSKVISAWWREIVVRGEPLRRGGFLRHIIEFPVEYFLSYMPWIPFMFFWRKRFPVDNRLKNLALYSMFFLLFSFPVYWLIPGARLRYLLPLSGVLVILITIPLYSLIRNEIYESHLTRRYTFILGVLITLIVMALPFLMYHYKLSGNSVMFVSGSLLLLIGFILISKKISIRMVLPVIVVSVLLVKTLWASTYFPYHREKKSYYRSAAQWINSIVPPQALIYDYKTGNPHLTFYLKRDVLAINKLQGDLKKDSFLITRKESVPELKSERLLYLGEVRARKMVILLYRIR